MSTWRTNLNGRTHGRMDVKTNEQTNRLIWSCHKRWPKNPNSSWWTCFESVHDQIMTRLSRGTMCSGRIASTEHTHDHMVPIRRLFKITNPAEPDVMSSWRHSMVISSGCTWWDGGGVVINIPRFLRFKVSRIFPLDHAIRLSFILRRWWVSEDGSNVTKPMTTNNWSLWSAFRKLVADNDISSDNDTVDVCTYLTALFPFSLYFGKWTRRLLSPN